MYMCHIYNMSFKHLKHSGSLNYIYTFSVLKHERILKFYNQTCNTINKIGVERLSYIFYNLYLNTSRTFSNK